MWYLMVTSSVRSPYKHMDTNILKGLQRTFEMIDVYSLGDNSTDVYLFPKSSSHTFSMYSFSYVNNNLVVFFKK